MKVGQTPFFHKDFGIHPPSPAGQKPSVSFQSLLANLQHGVSQETMTSLYREILAQGERVAHSRSLKDLARFKHLIRQWIDLAVKDGIGLEHRRGWNRRGRGRIYKILTQIDEKLIELTDMVLDQEKTRIDILQSIGEIQGLLINLYL